MRQRFGIFMIFSLALCAATGRAQESDAYRPEQMQADLSKFERALTKIHPGVYTHQTLEEFEKLVDGLKSEASRPLDAKAFYRLILRLIASIHDGHTQAYAVGKLGDALDDQGRLPFQVYVRGERIFIVRDLSSQGIPEGSEILSLDGHLSNEIILEVSRHYSSDGPSLSGMRHWLGGPYKPFYRIYPEVYGGKPSYDLVYRDYETKEIVAIEVDAISKETYQAEARRKYPAPERAEEAFDFDIDEKRSLAYLKISRFFKDGYDEPESTYPDFYRECFGEIHRKKIRNLIIDLRDNGGGKASNAAYLLQYFIDEPITPAKEISTLGNNAYYLEIVGATLDLDSSFGLAPLSDGRFRVTRADVLRDLMSYSPVEEYRFTGTLIVLINGGTTSAAGVAAGLLMEFTDATFVGEETYGYAGISNGVRQVSVKGDHTETAIYLPLLHAEYSVNEHLQRRGVVPDFQVSNSIQEILSARDAVLEFAGKNLLSANDGPG